tara:strand:+ start:2138 stop:5008 length:2871 start_codon:yes stop_codon:yes gene_type:complete
MVIRELIKEFIEKQKLEETIYTQRNGDTEYLYSAANLPNGIPPEDVVINSANNTPGHEGVAFASKIKVKIPIRKVTRMVEVKGENDILTIKPHAEPITEIERDVRVYAPYQNENSSYGQNIALLRSPGGQDSSSIYNITKILKEPGAQIDGVTTREDENNNTFYVEESPAFVDEVAQTTYDLTSWILGELQADKLVFAESSGRLNRALREKFSDIAISPNKAVTKISKQKQLDQENSLVDGFEPKYYESRKLSFMATFDHDYFESKSARAQKTLEDSFISEIPKGLKKKDVFRDFGEYLDIAASTFGQETVEKYRTSKSKDRQLKVKDFSKQIKVPTEEIDKDPSKSITGDNLTSGGLATAYYRPFSLSSYIKTPDLNKLLASYQPGQLYNSPFFNALKPVLLKGLNINSSHMEYFEKIWVPSFIKKLYLEIERGSIIIKSQKGATSFNRDFNKLLTQCVNKGVIETHESNDDFYFDILPISLLPRVDVISSLTIVGFKNHLRNSLRDLFYISETPALDSTDVEVAEFDKTFEEAYLKAQAAAFNYRIKNMDYKSSIFDDLEFRKEFLDIFKGILITDFHKDNASRDNLGMDDPNNPGELIGNPGVVSQIFLNSTQIELESTSGDLLKKLKRGLTEKGEAASDEEIQAFLQSMNILLPEGYQLPPIIKKCFAGKESIYYPIVKQNKRNFKTVYDKSTIGLSTAFENEKIQLKRSAFQNQIKMIMHIDNWINEQIINALATSGGPNFQSIIDDFEDFYKTFFNQVMLDVSNQRFSSLSEAYSLSMASKRFDEEVDLTTSINLELNGRPGVYKYIDRSTRSQQIQIGMPRFEPISLTTGETNTLANMICDLLDIEKDESDPSLYNVCKSMIIKDIKSNINLMEKPLESIFNYRETGNYYDNIAIKPIVIFDDSVNTGASLKNIIRYIFVSLANSNVDTSYLESNNTLPIACITSFLYK